MKNYIQIPNPVRTTESRTKGTEIMESMLLNQYAGSTNLKEYMGAFVSEMDLLFAAIEDVYLGRFLENAVGAQLDVIGVILDEQRDVNLPTAFFGFNDEGGSPTPNVSGFADEASPQDGGIFLSEDQEGFTVYPLSDGEYRNLLLAKASLLNNDAIDANRAYYAISTLLGKTPRVMVLDTINNFGIELIKNGEFLTQGNWTASTADSTLDIINERAALGMQGLDIMPSDLASVARKVNFPEIVLPAGNDAHVEFKHEQTTGDTVVLGNDTVSDATWVGVGSSGAKRGVGIPEVTLTGDFDIEFSWQRVDKSPTGISLTQILGNGADDRLQIYDSAHASSPDRVSFVIGGGYKTIDSAFAGIKQFQYIDVKVTRRGSVFELYIDDVSKGEFSGSSFADFHVSSLGLNNGSEALGVYNNLSITDYTISSGDQTIVYPVNEDHSERDLYDFNDDGYIAIPEWTPNSAEFTIEMTVCLLYTSPSPRD